jgi:CheY-like chemotaxis protein
MATVLIVEDQTQILALARALLEEEGYKTLTAPSAEDALVILAGSEPGLKVIYSTGLTLAHEIKALLVPGAVILEHIRWLSS